MLVVKAMLGMTHEEFLKDYWQKRPLFVKRAVPSEFLSLKKPDMLRLAEETHSESRFIKNSNGKFSVNFEPCNSDFESEDPWTVLIQEVESLNEDVYRLKEAFGFIPHWRTDDVMVSFATNGGGVGPHLDNYDVFLIQGEGTRSWRVSEEKVWDPVFLEDCDLQILETFPKHQKFQAEKGDLLYLPPGFAHDGIAKGECMTYSIGFRSPSVADMLVAQTEQICQTLSVADRYCDLDLQLGDPFEIDARAIERVSKVLEPFFNKRDPKKVAAWFGKLVTEPKRLVSASIDESVEDIISALKSGKKLVRHPSARLAYSKSPDLVFANGECLEGTLPKCLLQRVVSVAEISNVSEKEVLSFLLDAGIFELR